ncbi:hypothetical protein L1987_57076 [Smallanthus sonchifolius]|uniref:Uncharacterized protein n=1 Tax=Smallanthus sonchifolius TaxID=185202 RepID=A0ACB9DBL4_9ASTR|nr:hypothetical protein L1987_57076 [Smallanthus sonchifolius]
MVFINSDFRFITFGLLAPILITFSIPNLSSPKFEVDDQHLNSWKLKRVMNAPDRYERFVLPEGTKKVSYERDTKIMNAASFTIEREDHTIGNIVRVQLHRDGNVVFAGYKPPHPLQHKIIVRVYTTSQSSPMQAYNQSITDLDKELDHLKVAFEAEVARASGELS